ncbi:MAG: MurR/RpiR family transcriptional regulator [Anaerolineaceae bacterium]
MNTEGKVDFNQIVGDHFKQLTKSEKRIANHLRKHQEECAFLSAGELAAQLELSEATMVRFARSLGFESYPEMRKLMQANYRQRVTHSARMRGRLGDLRETGDVFEKLVVSDIDYMTQALETVSRDELKRAVDMIRSHKRIFVFGVGPSITLVDLMELRLTRFGKQVVPLRTAGREILDPLVMMNDQDLIFVICFFDVSPTLHLVLDFARESNCPVIMLTDTLGTILGNKADVILEAKRGPMSEFHSLVVPMTIINSLLLTLASEEKAVMENLDKLDQLRDRFAKYGDKLS